MKSVKRFLDEKKGEKAHKMAIAMGLKYKGFGYWQDAQGNVTHKTEGDELVQVEPEQFSDKAEKGSDQTADMAPSGGFGNPQGVGASFDTFQNKQTPIGTGTNIQGVADTGVAQAPNTDNKRWEPGPDGDNFITTQDLDPRNHPPSDAFVGKTNYYAWTAGAQGTNYTNLSFQDMLNKAKGMTEAVDPPAGYGAQSLINKVKQGGGDSVVQGAKSVLDRAGERTRQQAMQSLEAGKPFTQNFANDDEAGEYTKAIRAHKRLQQMPLTVPDKSRVNDMNEAARSLVQDPNYDMSQLGDELGFGSFGSVHLSPDGKNVIKKGQIGPAELIALHKMRNNPAFPSLINAKFDTPFRDESLVMAQELGLEPNEFATKQYDKDDMSGFEDKFPTAEGTFAMTKAAGVPLYDAPYEWTPEQGQEALKKIWKARAAMHMAGLSHNDMHGGNIYWDPDTENISLLDMGLAQDNPMAALMEAFGGVSGQDTQLDSLAGLGKFDDEDQTMTGFKDRLWKLQEAMENELIGEDADPEDMDIMNLRDDIGNLFEGGIRMKDRDLGELRDKFNLDDNKIKNMIKSLYGNFGMSDLEGRMSDAFDKRAKDTRQVALANLLRRQRGEEEIEVTNPNVIPPKNLIKDPDD